MNIETTPYAASGHTLRGDGMSYPSLNPLHVGVPSQAAAVAAAASAANAPPQTSHYAQGTPLQTSAIASASTGNLHALTPHAAGMATSTPAVLSLPNQHSQGPTPASTPPSAQNDPKNTGHYAQRTAAVPATYPPYMSFNGYERMFYQQPHAVARNQTPHPRMCIPRNQQLYILPANVQSYPQLPIQQTQIAQNHSAVGMNPHYQTEYQSYYVQQAPPASQNFSPYQSYRTTPVNNIRASNPTLTTVSFNSTSVTPTMPFSQTVSQMAPLPSQLQPRSQKKERKFALKITHPETGEEVKPDETNQNSQAVREKIEENEVRNNVVAEFATKISRRATESSSNDASSAIVSSYAKKDSATVSALNGTDRNAVSYTPANDWKSTPPMQGQQQQQNNASIIIQNVNDNSSISSSGSSNSNAVESVVNSLKSSNVASITLQSAKMDYKRPTREESPATGANDVEDVKLAAWPDSGAARTMAAPEAAVTTADSRNVDDGAVTSKKIIPKECETVAVSSSPVGSLTSSGVAATMVPSLTPSKDGLNKASSVTSTSVVLDDIKETASSRKSSKQGIQSNVVVADEDAATKQPPAVKPSGAPTASSQTPLPIVSQASATSNVPSPAQSNVTKIDGKSATSSQQPNLAKPSASALQTSGPVTEKPSPIATSPAPFGQPFPSKMPASVAQPATAVSADKGNAAKDEKNAPSNKTKNRGKENAEVNVDQSGAKKSAQSVSAKHHNAEAVKPAPTAPAASVASKQTNGEAAELQSAAEGKPKKSKKSAKKEMINKKGNEKEGSDMDVFTEKPSSPVEKSRSNEKVTAQITNNNTSGNRSNKTNSSQKTIDDKEDISAGEPKKELVNSSNIPSTQAVSAADSNKTVQPAVVESGPRKYSVEFLLKLRDLPQCKKPVKISPNLENQLYADHTDGYANMNRSQSNFSIPSSHSMFMPSFMATRNSMSLPTRKSQQGRLKNDRQAPIHVTLSLKEDVPLRHSKDAWKPARLNPDMRNLSADEKKTQELYKTVTGILNKLTPEKFEHLIERIRNLPIDNVPRLQGVIDLIFEKAIDEPGFCKWYAEMCHVMQTLSVAENESGKAQSFRTLLINKCQQQFERDKAEELDVIKKQEEIHACTDAEKKKELQLLFEETERKVRRRSVGNCRFIGELFKLQMLTAKIMSRCINKLLSSTDEESLECLCKLLTTIGKDLEAKSSPAAKKELDQFFEKMQDLSENKKHKVSSRIRFMLQDVIDLRKNNWVPRREADNPKKIDQINTEIERKEQEIKMMNLQPPRRPDDHYRNRDYNKKGTRTGSQNEEEWKTVKNYKSSYKVDTNKFTAISNQSVDLGAPDMLGSSDIFKKWGGGAATGKANEKRVPAYPSFSMDKPHPHMASSNNYRSFSNSNKVTPSSSMEKPRPYLREDEATGKISRSGSAQNVQPSSRESSVPRQPPSRNASQNARQPSAPPMLPEDQLTRACATIYQEFDSNNDLKDSLDAFEERFNPKQVAEAVRTILSHMIENKPKMAASCGILVANLIKRGTVAKQHFMDALKFLVDLSEDLIIDCPKLWVFLADATSPLIAEDCLQISELQAVFPGSPLLDHISTKPSTKSSSEIVEDKDGTLKKLLLNCLNDDSSDNVVKWIDENFENSRNSSKFVHKLSTIICQILYEECSKGGSIKVDDCPLFEEIMKKYTKFFKIYIENKGELEMQCLTAVTEFVSELQYPSGLLLRIFELLYDFKLISYDSYLQYKNSNDGRHRFKLGVAVSQLRQFYQAFEDEQASEEQANSKANA